MGCRGMSYGEVDGEIHLNARLDAPEVEGSGGQPRQLVRLSGILGHRLRMLHLHHMATLTKHQESTLALRKKNTP